MVLFPSRIDTVIDKDQIEREFLRVPKISLRLIGFWPEDKLFSWKVLPLLCASFFILCLAVIVEVSFVYTHVSNLPLALDAVCPALTKGVTLIKFVMILRTRDEVSKMLNHLKQLWIDGNYINSEFKKNNLKRNFLLLQPQINYRNVLFAIYVRPE